MKKHFIALLVYIYTMLYCKHTNALAKQLTKLTKPIVHIVIKFIVSI